MQFLQVGAAIELNHLKNNMFVVQRLDSRGSLNKSGQLKQHAHSPSSNNGVANNNELKEIGQQKVGIAMIVALLLMVGIVVGVSGERGSSWSSKKDSSSINTGATDGHLQLLL